MRLADLVLDRGSPDALRWFWTWADGELGLKSNFAAMVAQLEGGHAGGGSSDDVEQRMIVRLEAAGRARRIQRAFERLTGSQRWILFKVFGPTARDVPGLGVVAPLAPFTDAARRAHRASGSDRSLEEWLFRLCHRCSQPVEAKGRRKKRRAEEKATAEDRATLEAIRLEADSVLRVALSRFAASRVR